MMPILNGAELAKLVKTNYPQIKILALSISGQGQLVNKMIRDSDISGYLLKKLGKTEFIIALEKIANGGV